MLSLTAGSILLALVVVAVAVRLRARRRWTQGRARADRYRYWHLLERETQRWDPLAQETYLQLVAQVELGQLSERTLRLVALYRLNQSIAARRAARAVGSRWFHALVHFIPRQIRAPWFDHLLEGRERMVAEGRSRRFIAWATAAQCLSLVLHLVWERVWDLLTPFKPRSQGGWPVPQGLPPPRALGNCGRDDPQD